MTPVEPETPEAGSHPRGTLVIMLIYGLAFAVGWLLLYFCLFLRRGPVGG